MNQLIHTTSPTLVLHQIGWGIPHAMWRNHAYAFYLDSITNSNGNTKFSLVWRVLKVKKCRNLFQSGALRKKGRRLSGQDCLERQSYISLNGNVENHNLLIWDTERRRIDTERQHDP